MRSPPGCLLSPQSSDALGPSLRPRPGTALGGRLRSEFAAQSLAWSELACDCNVPSFWFEGTLRPSVYCRKWRGVTNPGGGAIVVIGGGLLTVVLIVVLLIILL